MVTPSVTLEDPQVTEPPVVWPPDDGGDGGGGDGAGGPRPRPNGPPIAASRLGVLIFCGTVVMLFAGILSALVILRQDGGAWPPPDAPTLVRDLWISTAFIIASSLAGFWAMAVRSGVQRKQLVTRLLITWALGLGFCLSQVAVWRSLIAAGIELQQSMNFTALFYLITALHVLHVVGGMFFLARSILRGRSGLDFRDFRFSAGNCLLYWHFVGLVWYFLFAFLHSK